MDSRLSRILTLLNDQKEAVPIKSLASYLKVSERTIYNDISKLNSLLKTFNYPIISNINGKVSYSVDLPVSIRKLKEKISIRDETFQRQMKILEYIILRKYHFTTDELSSFFYISKSTVLNDIASLRKWLNRREINITTIPFKGYVVEGDEVAIRSVMINHLAQEKAYSSNSIRKDEMQNKIENFLIESSKKLEVEISDESFDRIILALWVSYHRVMLNFYVNKDVFTRLLSKEEKYFIDNSQKLEKLFDKPLPIEECRYIAMKFSEASFIEQDQWVSENWITFNLITRFFIEEVSKEYDFDYFLRDETLFKGVINHLRPAYQRSKSKETIINPLYDYVIDSHLSLHKVILKVIKEIEEKLKVYFSSHEASYFTLLFASSQERNKMTKVIKPTVIIVCHAGMSTSEILRSKIVTNFNVDLLGTFSIRSAIEWLNNNNVDLIISTVEFSYQSYSSIQVNPYLSTNDKERLNRRLQMRTAPLEMDRLINIIRKSADVINEDLLVNELNDFFGISKGQNVIKKGYQPMLMEVLNERFIKVNAGCRSRDDAVKECGRLLVSADCAEERYIQAMIDNVEENGTYIVIAPGIAMPHARPEKGAKAIGLSIVTLEAPVKFGHPTNDPVELVVGLSAIDHQTHLKALSELVDILGNKSKVELLNKATSAKEVIEIIKGGQKDV